MNCLLCPRSCAADRIDNVGFCGAPAEPAVSAICSHCGEEPPLCGTKGICNVFFAYCNLGCVYCQNKAISTPSASVRFRGVDAIVDAIAQQLTLTENIVGFVTPSHYADHIPAIVEGLRRRGLNPTTVYNTSGYDRVDTLKTLAPYIDIYLPDFKYMDADLAQRYSRAADYPAVALEAIKEMYAQKGAGLPVDDSGMAYRGIIVRHLVLPGQIDNTLAVLEQIAEVSPRLHVSLMAQYYPIASTLPDQLGRLLTAEEYDRAVAQFHAVGLHRGWVQDLAAQSAYRPDFSKRQPFAL